MLRRMLISLIALLALSGCLLAAGQDPAVELLRVPQSGVQPQAAVDERGTLHLIYLRGDAAAADVQYVRSTDGGQTFSEPLRVNSQPASAMAIGTVRGRIWPWAGPVACTWLGWDLRPPGQRDPARRLPCFTPGRTTSVTASSPSAT